MHLSSFDCSVTKPPRQYLSFCNSKAGKMVQKYLERDKIATVLLHSLAFEPVVKVSREVSQ
jgi:hypothetical protein